MAARGEDSLRIEGDAAALQVDARQSTIADVLSALRRFNVRYRSSIALNEIVDGTYAGSSGQVVSRVLDGYNFAIKQANATLEVMVIGRIGEQAVPATIVIPVRRRPSD